MKLSGLDILEKEKKKEELAKSQKYHSNKSPLKSVRLKNSLAMSTTTRMSLPLLKTPKVGLAQSKFDGG